MAGNQPLKGEPRSRRSPDSTPIDLEALLASIQLLERTVEERTRELSALVKTASAITSTLALRPLMDMLLDNLRSLIEYDGAGISLREGDEMRQLAVRRPPGVPTEPESPEPDTIDSLGEAWALLNKGQSFVVDDVLGPSALAAVFRRGWGGDLKGSAAEYIRSTAVSPLLLRGEVTGILTVSHSQPDYFKERHLDLLRAVAHTAAGAIENARLFEETDRRERELSALLDVSRALGSTLELRPLLGVILDQLRTVVTYDGAGISMIEGDCARQIAARRPPGYPEMEPEAQRAIPLTSFGMVWDLVRREQALIIDDILDDSEVATSYRSSWGADQPPVEYARSYAIVPLVIGDQVTGSLAMAHHQPGYFKQEHVEVVRTLAGQAAAAIANSRLFEQTERRERELAALLGVSRAVASSLDPAEVLGTILDQLGTIIQHTGSSILLLKNGALEFVEARTVAANRAEIGARIPLDAGSFLWDAVIAGEPVLIDDVRADEPQAEGFRAAVSSIGDLEQPPFSLVRSWMAVPLALKDRTLGALTISWTEPSYFTADHARLARAFADQAAIAIENARLFDETQRRVRETEALFRADAELFQSLDLDRVLQALVDVTVDIVGADRSMVATWKANEPIRLRTAPQETTEAIGEVSAVLESLRSERERVLSAGVIIMEGIDSAHESLRPVWEREGIQAVIEVPIKSPRNTLLGAFTVTYLTPHSFSPEEQRLLKALAERAAVAIENAELYQRAQLAASLEERQRLARELHDSVSQALYGIALGARTARTLLDRNPAAAADPVEYVLSLAEAGMAEMRALIFELRPESLETEGLVAAIGKQLDALRARHGITVTSIMSDEPDLPLATKEAAYRIAQESLTNTTKHAKAGRVTVRLAAEGDAVTLIVADDGTGFDTSGNFPGHLGLRSMRERAEKCGGTFTIESAPDSGTRVLVSFPSG